MAQREEKQLPIVKAHLELQLGRSLRRLPEHSSGGPTHDLETIDGNEPCISIEVKEVVPGEFLATRARVTAHPGFDSKVLKMRWNVVVMEEGLDARLASTPNFPEDPDKVITDQWSSQGFTIMTKAEREEQWKQGHSLSKRPTIVIKNLAKDIEPYLDVLESAGVVQTRNYRTVEVGSEDFIAVHNAVEAISRRTNNSICMGRSPKDCRSPGIDLVFGYGGVRTGRADIVALRAQSWLDSELAANLKESLASSPVGERHAVLWFSADPETDSAAARGDSFCPGTSLILPDCIDVVWIFLGPISLRYDGEWNAYSVDSN
jgi:hypothetical protein